MYLMESAIGFIVYVCKHSSFITDIPGKCRYIKLTLGSIILNERDNSIASMKHQEQDDYENEEYFYFPNECEVS